MKEKNTLTIHVIAAEDLSSVSLMEQMSPCVSLKCGRVGHVKEYKTRPHINGGSNPRWNQSFEFNLDGKEDQVHFTVFNCGILSDKNIGSVSIPVVGLANQSYPCWIDIQDSDGTSTGRLYLRAELRGAQTLTKNKTADDVKIAAAADIDPVTGRLIYEMTLTDFQRLAAQFYDEQGKFAGTLRLDEFTASEIISQDDTTAKVKFRYFFVPVNPISIDCRHFGSQYREHGDEQAVFHFKKDTGKKWDCLRQEKIICG